MSDQGKIGLTGTGPVLRVMSEPMLQISSVPRTPPCRGLMGAVFGHKFESRIEVENNTLADVPAKLTEAIKAMEPGVQLATLHVQRIADAFTDMTDYRERYVGDVCARCGCTINKGKQS